MDDATRVTWAGVLLTLGGTMAFGLVLRWLVWTEARGSGAHPQVMWTMGFLALGLLLAAAQLYIPALIRQAASERAESERRAAGGDHWG
jgi:Trk-type K+ transport system membrane component